MSAVGAYEAKTHLPRLLEETAAGKRFVITKHGVPVARLVPVHGGTRDPEEVVAALRELRQGMILGDLSIRDLIEEGRL